MSLSIGRAASACCTSHTILRCARGCVNPRSASASRAAVSPHAISAASAKRAASIRLCPASTSYRRAQCVTSPSLHGARRRPGSSPGRAGPGSPVSSARHGSATRNPESTMFTCSAAAASMSRTAGSSEEFETLSTASGAPSASSRPTVRSRSLPRSRARAPATPKRETATSGAAAALRRGGPSPRRSRRAHRVSSEPPSRDVMSASETVIATPAAVADVRLEHLTKRFDDVVAVDDISLEIERGKFFALLGPSGCGKTTTLRMIGGFEEPTAGRIELGGQDVGLLPPYKRDVNTVFQSYALFPHLTIFENVAFGLRRKKLRGNE